MTDPSLVLEVGSLADLQASPSNRRIEPNTISAGFHESTRYAIQKPADSGRFLIDDQDLESTDGHWVWDPGFYAGLVRAELLSADDHVRATYLLDVSPHPDKLGRDSFQLMLDQIWQFDPSLVLGTEPAQSPVGHEAQIGDPWIEYARLRSYGEKFVRALSAIAHRPIRELRSQREHLPLERVRRADRQTVLAALQDSHLLSVLVDRDSISIPISALPPFDVPVARETLDSAGNRCIAAIAHMVTRRAVSLRAALQAEVDQDESDTRTSLLSRWPRRRDFLDRMVRLLRHLQRSSPLVEVTRREISAEGLNAVSADPAYACAYGLGWRILRHGIEGSPDSEHLWISPTWEIYERWCFVQLGKAIRALEPVYRWSISRNHKSKATAAFIASNGRQVCIELLLQPKFPAGDQRLTAGFQSISGRREPDIVLARTDRDGPKWYVLDAKYRTTRSNVLDAMASAHIYRDSLRWNERRPERAVLLVPRSGGAPWMEQPDFIRQHRVGVCALGPATDLSGISQLLSGIDG